MSCEQIENFKNFKTESIAFPKNPKEVTIDGHLVHEYISPDEIDRQIKRLSEVVDLKRYETLVVNMKGGEFLFRRLVKLQHYKGSYVEVEYHRPENGFGAIEKIPVPKYLTGAKVVVIDDIRDSGGTANAIMKNLSPESLGVFLVTKGGIENQIIIPNSIVGVKVDGRGWCAGCGMDGGYKDEGEAFREYPGLLVVNYSAGKFHK